MSRKELMEEVLNPSPQKRAELAREIISSLDGPPDADAATAWAVEVERRVREVKDGSVRLTDWAEVRRRVEARLREKA